MKQTYILLSLLLLLLLQADWTKAAVFDCPTDWTQYQGNCYKFVTYPRETFDDATRQCATHGAALVSVETQAEHNFISETLQRFDSLNHDAYTSGRKETAEQGAGPEVVVWTWQGTGEAIEFAQQYWLPGVDRRQDGFIVYKFGVLGYGWGISPEGAEKNNYICEISQSEAFRIITSTRTFDFGLKVANPNDLPRGPRFMLQPRSLVVVEGAPGVDMECEAYGNPQPTYRWFQGTDFSTEITADIDQRYTLTNGHLSIQNPSEGADANDYRCVATNEYGSIISNPVTLSFGSLGEFSNVQDAPVRANAYDGASIQCSRIAFKPAVRYQWMRNNTMQFVRTELQTYIFISNNGKIYFSEVTRADAGDYRCMAVLTGLSQQSISTVQPPTAASLPIELVVRDQAPKADWGPEIHNDFPAVFPSPPLRGMDIRIECFAYGTSKTSLQYSWYRTGRPMPRDVEFLDLNRVMIIKNAQLEDQGNYTCVVQRGSAARDEKTLSLTLAARPYFIVGLKDQHMDLGAQLTWRCDARANPVATYSWFKNGQRLASVPGDLEIHSNTLVIFNVREDHAGMYQCRAQNSHGVTFSSGQLRVLSFAPYFDKRPLPRITDASINGNVTMLCQPEAAPQAEITWQFRGAELGSGTGRVQVLETGTLVITGVQQGDQGLYTCRATNVNGEATSSTTLHVSRGTVITVAPVPVRVVQNETAFLPCLASFDPALDLVYYWRFNGVLVNVNDGTHVQSTDPGREGLYVTSADFIHAGEYTCTARTTLDEAQRSAVITVRGPPGEPAGLFIDAVSVTSHSAELQWTPAPSRGAPVQYYVIEVSTDYNPAWRVHVEYVAEQETITDLDPTLDPKRKVIVDGLLPGNSYRFRLRAANEYGLGDVSIPSPYIRTIAAPPRKAPENVRGGGGSVGELTIRWDPLVQEERGGPGLGYFVYYRRQLNTGNLWRVEEIKDPLSGMYVALVGADNYYLEYEVKIGTFNDLGRGPNSTIVVIFSAEDMPLAVPTNIQNEGFNSTALEVSWDPVPDDREHMKGRVAGYQINYWPEDDPSYLRFTRYRGQLSTGMVIGLWADSNFYVDVQVYNTAGLGPRSEEFLQETSSIPPLLYPEEVRIFSDSSESVRVWWRGISITTDEDPVSGFRLYYWAASEDFRSYKNVDVDQGVYEAVIDGLEKGVIYSLRVAALSGDGEGKKSPTKYFTLGGAVRIDASLAQAVDVFLASGPRGVASPVLVLAAAILAFLHRCFFD